ncbi:MAG: hypothetical protein AAF721_19855 [Myxococcota bacterium]
MTLLAACAGDDGDDDGGSFTTAPTSTTLPNGSSGDPTSTTGEGSTAASTDDGVDPDSSTGSDIPDVTVCQFECATNDDCFVMGADIGQVCGARQICFEACASDLSCQLPGANLACMTNMECADAVAGVCIDFGGGAAFCVNPENPMVPCDAGGATPLNVTDVDGAPVVVCSTLPDTTCASEGGDMMCTTELQPFDCATCSAPLGCDRAARTCTCVETEECETAGVPGECIEGRCIDACEGDADCEGLPNSYDGGAWVCK